MKELQSIIDAYREAEAQGKRAALATVVKVTGSTYRRAGARMLITADGQTIGSVSGGCLEHDVIDQARRVIQSNEPRVVTYDSMSDDDIVWGLGLGCNGIVEILIEPLSRNGERGHMAFLAECLRRRHTGVLATVFAVEGQTKAKVGSRLILSEQRPAIHDIGDSDLADAILNDSRVALGSGLSKVRTYEMAAGCADVFIEVIQPPVPLVIFGAGHDAVPLVRLAKVLGWHVTLVDHRPAYATRMRFPSADVLIVCRAEEVLERVEIELRTVVAIMTHNYLHDLKLLRTLLPTPLRYIGILGPKSRTRRLLDDIQANGQTLSEKDLGRLYGPIGLDIGAVTPEEIALAVVAEITAVLTGRLGGVLRNREGPLHQSSEATDAVTVSGRTNGTVYCGTNAGTPEEETRVREEKRAPSVAIIILAAGAKQIIAAHASEFVRVPFPQGTTDIDTPEDYLGLQSAILSQTL